VAAAGSLASPLQQKIALNDGDDVREGDHHLGAAAADRASCGLAEELKGLNSRLFL